MRLVLKLIALTMLLTACTAQQPKEKHELRFHDGKFKIAQLTDIHYSATDKRCVHNADTIVAVLERERPDLVIMTGDVVTGRPAAEGWKYIMDMMAKVNIPYAVTMGNHDAEQMERDSIFDILATDPLFIGEKGPGNLKGCGTYALPILGSQSDKVSAVIYCLDSNDYPTEPTLGDYGWIEHEKISWYRQTSAHYTSLNGGEPLPALAFFHIATPEFRLVDKAPNMYGCNKEGSGVGAPELNSGMLTSCIDMGDVMGMFVGHDHDNDYIGLHYGIALAYGRVSGLGAYGDLPRGARIIELTEGKHEFNTWITTPAGTELKYHYPTGITQDDVSDEAYLPASNITPKRQGVAYTYYEGMYKSMKDVPAVGKKVSEGTKSYFSLDGAAKDHFAYDFRAYINIPERDLYIFHLANDDGAQLFIDGKLVVDNGDGHSMRRPKSGKAALEKGFHDIRVVYYENYMGQGLKVDIESRGITRQTLPENMLYVKE